MTTINCSLNCKYQSDGQCNLNNFCSLPISSNPDCAYFQPVEARKARYSLNVMTPKSLFL